MGRGPLGWLASVAGFGDGTRAASSKRSPIGVGEHSLTQRHPGAAGLRWLEAGGARAASEDERRASVSWMGAPPARRCLFTQGWRWLSSGSAEF